jgi:glycosyltransferase involved in cell wall biosynthesis
MALQTEQLARLLGAAGARVDLLQTNAPYRPRWVASVPGLRALFRLLPYLLRLWRCAGRVDVVHLMANSGWSWHLFAAPAIWIAHWRGTPVVVNYRGGGAAEFLRGSERQVRATLARAAALIVPSGFLQEVFGRHGLAASIVPNIVDLSRYAPATSSVQGRRPHLIVTRNLEPIYDNASAIRALALLRAQWPDARLTLAGSGPELAHLQAVAAGLGLGAAVQFAGRLERQAMAELYRSADLMWNPSLTDNMPNSVLEALASGVPVVSTSVGGVPYLLEHGRTGLLVEPAQPAALAEAAARVLGDAGLRASLVSAGLEEVRRYTWDQVAPLLHRSYLQAMGKGSTE